MRTAFYRVIAWGVGMGDPGRRIGDFAFRDEAENFAKGKSDWGGDASVSLVHAVSIEGKVYELASPAPVELIQATPEVF